MDNNVGQNTNQKRNNGLIAIVVTIIVLIIGGGIYYAFIKDDRKTPPTPTNAPTTEPTPSGTAKDKFKENTTYKSKDGNSILTVNKIDDSEDDLIRVDVTYKGKNSTISIFNESMNDNKYLSISDDFGGIEGGQCPSSGLLLNLDTKTIEKENNSGIFYEYIKVYEGYFFLEASCLDGYNIKAFDSNWKELGRLVATDYNNIYVFSDKKIIKYDLNGNKLKEYNTDAIITGPGTVHNDGLFYLSTETTGTYLIDNDNNEKIKLNDNSYDNMDPYTGSDVKDMINISSNGNLIIVNYDGEYQYNTNGGDLKKIS